MREGGYLSVPDYLLLITCLLPGPVAHLVERFHGMEEVRGSIPLGSTILRPSGYGWRSHSTRPSGYGWRSHSTHARLRTTGALPFMKTHYIGYVAASVDGRIALDNKKLPDWTSREDWRFFQKQLAKADAVVVGRTTYELAATRLRRRTTYVLTSRVPTTRRRGTVTFINPQNVSLTTVLSRYKTVAVIGGGFVYRTMLNAGLLDELYVTIEPLLLGRGVPMIASSKKTTKLRLLSARRLNKTGTILLRYAVRR